MIIQVRGKIRKRKRTQSNQHGPRLARAPLRNDPLEKFTYHVRQGGSTPYCFRLHVSFLLSPPSFHLFPLLIHRRPLRRPHTFNAGGFLSSGIPGGRPSRAGWRRQGLVGVHWSVSRGGMLTCSPRLGSTRSSRANGRMVSRDPQEHRASEFASRRPGHTFPRLASSRLFSRG